MELQDSDGFQGPGGQAAVWRLEGWRIVDRLPRRVGGVRGGSASLVYAVGPAGRRLLDEIRARKLRRLGTPGDRHVAHTLAITELVVRLHEADLGGELDLVQLQTEPACWREFLGGLLATRVVLKPDLFARVGAGAFEDRYFIELDLGTEHIATLIGKAKRYLAYYRSGEEQSRHEVFPRVVWTVPDRRRAEEVAEALRRAANWDRAPVRDLALRRGHRPAGRGGHIMTPRNVVLEGDALEVLRTLAPASVEAVMTSPPYFRARRYEAGPAELGQEVDVDTWAENLRAVSREIARVLVPTGSYWLNLGDVYSRNLKLGAPPKSLLLGPERLIRGLLADGWMVRNRVAWVKTTPLPSPGDRSVDDRLGVRLAPGAPAELLLRPGCDPGAAGDAARPWAGPPL